MMFAKKPKVKSVRNILESPFPTHCMFEELLTGKKRSEKSEDEIIPIQNALKELLPDAKLEQVALNRQALKNNRNKESNKDVITKRRQHNIFREFLALGFQSVIRGLEKKELCCVVLAGNITPILQKVVLAQTLMNNVPVTIIPDLKRITKCALGFATMVLGFKAAVADTTNKFFSIYLLVSQNPMKFDMAIPKQNEDVVMDQTDKPMESNKAPLDNEDLYVYRSQIGERVFIPRLKTKENNEVVNKKEGSTFGRFLRLKQDQSSPTTQISSSSDDTDSDVDNIFFVDKKQDVSLLSKKLETNNNDGKKAVQSKVTKFKKNTKKGISFNLSKTDKIDLEYKPTNSSSKPQNTKKFKKFCHKIERNQQCLDSLQEFYPLTIKTITQNSKKVKRKKKKKSTI